MSMLGQSATSMSRPSTRISLLSISADSPRPEKAREDAPPDQAPSWELKMRNLSLQIRPARSTKSTMFAP